MPPGGRGGRDSNDEILVLHVDDEPDFADLAQTFLERENDALDVVTATNATEGLEALHRNPVDCVVSDYDMPGRNGIEFLEAVRDANPDVPFLLFTGKGSEEIASDAISAGVTDYLQKGSGTEQYTLLANRIQNVVERERSKRALEEHNRRLETLIQNLPGMVYRCRNEPEWPMEYVGGEVQRLTGYTAGVIESGAVVWGDDVIVPDDQGEAWNVVQDALESREPFELTYRITTKAGEGRTMWERGRGIYDDTGDLEALEGFITDVTDQRQREQELEQKNARLEALFENSPDLINVHDADGVIVDANQRFCNELGYTEDEILGRYVCDVDVDASPSAVQAMRAETTVGDRRKFEATFERRDGSRFSVDVHLTQLDVDGEDLYLAIGRKSDDQ